MVAVMQEFPTIEEPAEALIRYRFMYEEILEEMDPSFPMKNQKSKEKIRKQIGASIRPIDVKFRSWLSSFS